MDKAAIKSFSIWARNKLIADIAYKAGLLGITEEGIKDALPQSTQEAEFYDIGTKEPYAIRGEEIKQRRELARVIQRKALRLEYKDAYQNVVEEVAYTWFNRLIAIRFMEVNDYMPAHIRALSSESGTKLEPDLVTAPFDAKIEFTKQEKEHILQLKNDNQVDALFRFLFIKQCNALNAYLPKLFEKTSDYTELLLNVSVTDRDGIVYHLTHDIKEADFNISNTGADGKPTGQVEIIGWMYQYYNTEPKNEAFMLLKKNVKITKERIPAATQLFTPDWIVRYMVENSIGRLWLEGHEDEGLKKGWEYYLDEAGQEAEAEGRLHAIREGYKKIKPEEIKVIDPCMGSGHILVYAFDVLMQIYESCGYSRRDAAVSIVENNIAGLDIDDRAFQLAYFAIMMNARSCHRRFLTLGIEPNLYAIQESNGIEYDGDMCGFLPDGEHRETLQYLLHTFVDAKEYGSILEVEKRDYDGFLQAWEQGADAALENILMAGWYMECNRIVPALAKQAKFLSEKYDVAVANPPYMGISNGDKELNKYVKKNYPDSKSDLFAVFIEKCGRMLGEGRFGAMITQQAWMFLSSFEKLRAKLQMVDMINMVHLGSRAFEEIGGEVVQTTSFVFRKQKVQNYIGTFCRLVNFMGEEEKKQAFLTNRDLYYAAQEDFSVIPGGPIAYWLSARLKRIYTLGTPLGQIASQRKGNSTSDNNRFLRLWHEVDIQKINFHCNKIIKEESKKKRWYPYNKGGGYKKWYGFNDYIIDWYDDASAIRNIKTAVIANYQYFMKPGLTWSTVSSNHFSIRWFDEGYIFDNGGCCIFELKDKRPYIMALLNSCVFKYIFGQLNPTLNFQSGEVAKFPVLLQGNPQIDGLALENVKLSKADWDSFETSWGFRTHPFLFMNKQSLAYHGNKVSKIADSFGLWKSYADIAFEKLKYNEEELNRIFIDIYGLQGELSPEVDDKDITVRKADLGREVRSFISFAVGCMFGRYSLDKEGLVLAGTDMKDIDACRGGASADTWNARIDGKDALECWKISADNIILITDEEYVADDIVNRFVEFVKAAYGGDALEENLDFIANALGNKGDSSKAVIRNYFLKDFFADHLKVYQKRPVYWLFDSGKLSGFKALIYMHRYSADTVGNLRVDYLHCMEHIYESEINRMQDTIDNSGNAREITAASKRKEKLKKQLKECQEYDEKIAHLALSRIAIDLDDGVKVNYEKVQIAHDGKKYQVLAKL